MRVKSYGVPLVGKLFEMGYDSPERLLELDRELIRNTKGFGPQKTEQLDKAIRKTKNNIRPTKPISNNLLSDATAHVQTVVIHAIKQD